jgi:beta-glucosidase-like glycosyl hydrolase
VEDLAGFIIQAIASKAKAAQAEAAQQQLARGRQGSPVLTAATPGAQGRRAVVKPVATPAPPPQTAGSTARREAADAAQGIEREAAAVKATAAAARVVPNLLAPFVHPHALLAAIVVSEALQPPLALRQRERP